MSRGGRSVTFHTPQELASLLLEEIITHEMDYLERVRASILVGLYVRENWNEIVKTGTLPSP